VSVFGIGCSVFGFQVSALPPAKKMPVKSKKNFEKANIE